MIARIAFSFAVLIASACNTKTADRPAPVVSPVTQAKPIVPDTAEVRAAGPLGIRLAERIEASAAAYKRTDQPLQRGTLNEGELADRNGVLVAGHCYRIFAVGSDGIQDLDLALFDGSGMLMLRDNSDDAFPTLGVETPLCPDGAGMHRIQVTAYKGAGDFLLQIMESPP